ncbi:MAG: choice-of-anchor L domain-containing protein [Bacteroidetes bacterium]|nr:choice-of-anchor L domain-containing protein [Bacteroidota bacterium]
MRSLIKKIALSFIALAAINSASAQLVVSGAYTPVQLVDTLLGTGVTASGITYTGGPLCRGIFNGVSSNIGFTSGVLLTCGNLTNAIGPNNLSSASVGNSLPGDPDLDLIMTPTTSYDATILEFDFVPTSDTVKFNYVFGSEEYMEYVSTIPGGINDGFGFFISGPGITGPFSGGAKNIALVPGTSLPVTMFNLNLVTNSAYYFDNGDGNGTGTAPDGATVQYDGFTVPLTAIAAVQCGETYHIKLAIGDGGDDILDSGVFLEAGSFSSQGVVIVPQISYGGANDSTLYEGCGLACIYFVRTSNLANADTINVTIAGSAINGVDYNTGVLGVPLPSVLYFAAGQDSISYCINAVSDGILEGLDTIQLSIIQTGPCASTATYATVYLNEYTPLTLGMNDTTFCNLGGTFTFNTNVTGGVAPYTYTWSGGLPSIPNPTTTVATTTTYVVTVNDACNSFVDPTPAIVDSATITVATFAPMVLNAGDDMVVCPGDLLNLFAAISGGGSPYTYTWTTVTGTDTVNSPYSAATGLTANGNGTYQVTITDVCFNTTNDQVAITVESSCVLNIPNVITPDGHGPAVNEFFYVENLDKFPGSSLAIYNRWGNKIYESSDYKNNWNGSKSVDGVYYYVLTVPVKGSVLASAKPNNPALKASSSEDNKVFAGYFQITRMK